VCLTSQSIFVNGGGALTKNMRTKTIMVNQCVPGMRISRDLFSKANSLIIPAGTILDEYSIRRLDDLLIPYVDIYEMTEIEIETAAQSFEKEYSTHLGSIKDIFASLDSGNMLRMETVRSAVGGVIGSNIGHRDVLHTLNGLRSVDGYTYTHSLNVGILAMMLARWSGISEDRVKQICYAGVLHDIGKARVPEHILNKPGKLSPEEFAVVKKHSVAGYDILKQNATIAEDIRQGVLMHHERIDGRGYPLGVTGDKINEYARIVAIADVFDAMVSDRCYKLKESPFNVLEHFENQCLGHLDPKFLGVFIEKMSVYFLGEQVRLSDGREAKVVFINPHILSRPMIQIGDVVLDLSKEKNISIAQLA